MMTNFSALLDLDDEEEILFSISKSSTNDYEVLPLSFFNESQIKNYFCSLCWRLAIFYYFIHSLPFNLLGKVIT